MKDRPRSCSSQPRFKRHFRERPQAGASVYSECVLCPKGGHNPGGGGLCRFLSPSTHNRRGVSFSQLFLINDSYVAGLGTFGALGNFKFNFVPFLKRFESFALDGRVVNKYVLAAFNFNKSKTLLVVKPFDSSCHWNLH
jgi:hypothetical protein